MKSRTVKIALLGTAAALPFIFLLWSQVLLIRHAGLRIGDTLPAADLHSAEGEVVSTNSWKGRPTLLVLFQPGCRACREEIAALSEVVLSLSDLRVVLLSLQRKRTEPGLPFPVLFDRSGAFLNKTRRLMVPALYWIDPDGTVAYERMGRSGAREELKLFAALKSRPRNTGK